jgi:hypothetical protein
MSIICDVMFLTPYQRYRSRQKIRQYITKVKKLPLDTLYISYLPIHSACETYGLSQVFLFGLMSVSNIDTIPFSLRVQELRSSITLHSSPAVELSDDKKKSRGCSSTVYLEATSQT